MSVNLCMKNEGNYVSIIYMIYILSLNLPHKPSVNVIQFSFSRFLKLFIELFYNLWRINQLQI